MQTPTKTLLTAAVILAGLLAGPALGARTAAAQPAAPSGQADLLGIVQQFVTAYNAGNTATLTNLFDPSYQGVITNMPPSAPPEATAPTSRATELQNAAQRLVHVTASNCALASTSTVRCDMGLSGGPTANLPHPYTETAVFTFANGKIVRLDETLSDTTRSDFAAIFAQLQQPGMPRTGAPDGATGPGWLFFLLAFGGLLLAVGGTVLRRRGASRY
jgi:hypothetical protein